jgi:IclR family mhp operon transcriptional activator
MLVRLNTDFTSPLTKNRFAVGHRISLVASASGRAYLAFCPSGQRSVIIDLVARSSARPEDASARNPSALYRDLAQVRAAGYATHSEGDRSAVAVPILWRRHPFACLALRYFTTALRAAEVRRKIVPEILSCAQAISSQFEQADPSAGIGSNDTVPG